MKLEEFGDELIRFCNHHLEENFTNVVKKAASDVHAHLVVTTPFKTGKARSNWLVTLNAPSTYVIPTHGAEASISTTLADAEAVIRQCKNNDVIYITNNVPYIQKLNEGSSVQAPAGFIEATILIAEQSIRKTYPHILKGLS